MADSDLFESLSAINSYKRSIIEKGAKFARMSGSKPTLFGIFSDNSKRGHISSVSFTECHLYTVRPFLLPKQGIPQN
ncbi:MAG: hypothetical protein V3T75_05990 [candidate division Zixibacteria bacterium]